jgi:hypothetical protein
LRNDVIEHSLQVRALFRRPDQGFESSSIHTLVPPAANAARCSAMSSRMRGGTVAQRGLQILSVGCDGKRSPDIDALPREAVEQVRYDDGLVHE